MDENTKGEDTVEQSEEDWVNFKAHPDDGDADVIDFAGVVEKLQEITEEFKGDPELKQVLVLNCRTFVLSLLRNAAPKVYTSRRTERFVKIAVSFYIDGGSNLIKQLLVGDIERK